MMQGEMVDTRVPCLLCGSTESTPVVIGYDRMEPRDAEYVYRRCASCGLVVQSPLPKPEEIPSLYPAHYAPHVGKHKPLRSKLVNRLAIRYLYGVDRVTHSWLLRRVFRMLSGQIMRGTREPHGRNRLLDIGCGSGNLLAQYRELGWTVRGIEINERACAVCRDRGLDVHQGTIFDAPFESHQFDMIFLNHVIEHVLDPVGVMRRAVELLDPVGKLVVITPNMRGIGFRLYGSCWYPLDAPRHLVLFDPDTLRRLGGKVGLVTHAVVTHSMPRMLCESRHYAATQGEVLPKGFEARRELLQTSAKSKSRYRAFRKLVSPLTLLCAVIGRGDIMEAEFRRIELQT